MEFTFFAIDGIFVFLWSTEFVLSNQLRQLTGFAIEYYHDIMLFAIKISHKFWNLAPPKLLEFGTWTVQNQIFGKIFNSNHTSLTSQSMDKAWTINNSMVHRLFVSWVDEKNQKRSNWNCQDFLMLKPNGILLENGRILKVSHLLKASHFGTKGVEGNEPLLWQLNVMWLIK